METINSVISFLNENKITITLTIAGLGRAYHALKNGGGLVGVYRSLMFGDTKPKIKVTNEG